MIKKSLLYLLDTLKLETGPVIDAEQIEVLFPHPDPVTPNKPGGGLDFKAGDASYNTTTVKDMEKFLEGWIIKFVRWSKRFDCDNFADIFMGWAKFTNPTQAVGKVWVLQESGYRHALNFFVYHEAGMFGWAYIEPQTGEIYHLTNKKVINWRPYFLNL